MTPDGTTNVHDAEHIEIVEVRHIRHDGRDYLDLVVEVDGRHQHYLVERWFPPTEQDGTP